jgi:AcrR family transcriptional regulator
VDDGGGAVSTAVTPTGGETEGSRRPMRADARKNQERILEAAEEVFALQGVSAPIDVVAERAGVGVGTVYRHFPTKEALFEAIVLSRLEGLASAATVATQADDASEVFFSFLRLFARQVSKKHDLIDALGAAGIDIKSRCSETVGEMESGVQRMLERAEAVGAVRGGISTQELIGLLVGACQASERSALGAASRERMVDIICDGLRPQPAAAPPGPAPRST